MLIDVLKVVKFWIKVNPDLSDASTGSYELLHPWDKARSSELTA